MSKFPRESQKTEFKITTSQGPFKIKDNFVMLLINRSKTTKVTTLKRIKFFRFLLFMGNGNGIVSFGKSRDLTGIGALKKAIGNCKKNLIAIPLDPRVTLPRAITARFQDYTVYLRTLAGFNSYGNPVFATMLALTGLDHCGFKTIHTGKNAYTLVTSFFKAVTKNITPQQMAEHEGFKVYRHRFKKILNRKPTGHGLSY
jgi:ribosomal protein S5